jgi:hypothetical protein
MDVEPNPTQIIIEEEDETEISEEEYREIINEMLKTENADANLVEESAPETVETLEPIIDSTPEDVAEIKTSPAPMNPQVRPGVN